MESCSALGFRLYLNRPKVEILPLLANHRNRSTNRYDGILSYQMFEDNAGRLGFDFHGGLIGFDLGQDLTLLDCIALCLHPPNQQSLGHIETQLGHVDYSGH